MNEHELSATEEALFIKLNQRQHEAESVESRLIAKYGSTAKVAKELWVAFIGLVVFIVIATAYVLTLQGSVARNAEDLKQLRSDVNDLKKEHIDFRFSLKDKMDKPIK